MTKSNATGPVWGTGATGGATDERTTNQSIRTDGGQQLIQRPAPQLSQDAVFSTLSSQRRRLVLRRLLQAGCSLSVRELTAGVAADENGIPETELTYKQRKRVYTSLHQTHLPKLDSVGLIEYDSNRGVVTLTDEADVVKSYLVGPETHRWPDYYLGLGIGLATLSLFAGTDISIFSELPDILVAGMGAAALLGVATWHAISTRNDTPHH